MIQHPSGPLYIRGPKTFTQGVVANPAAGAILADTGQAPAKGEYTVYVVAWASAAAQMTLQHRDAANAANIAAVEFGVPAGDTVSFSLPFSLDVNERVRVVMRAALTGNAAAAIVAEHRVL